MKPKRILPAAFCVLWTAALCFPQVARLVLVRAHVVSWKSFSERSENRHPAQRPSLRRNSPRHVEWKDYGRGLEAWYNDAFPWRTELIRFQRKVSFHWLKTPSGRDVPGRGEWIFRRGGDWPELDDYLGAFELTPEELDNWLMLFEGRREWAAAIGSHYLAVPSPVKAQVRWQELYPAIRRHRGNNVAAQVRKALETSPARDDVLFADDDFLAAFEAGREVFFDADHHPCAYGEWLLYDRINRRLAEIFPDLVHSSFPWYDDPPPDVLAGKKPGCWLERGGDGLRLDISSPGETQDDDGVPPTSRRFPYTNVATVREGGGISILMAHDSYMRFTLASWRRPSGSVRFPFAQGVGRVRAHIFQRFSQGSLESLTADEIPDVLIEQFPECRLDGTAKKYMDDGIRAAAAFGRADAPGPDRVPHAGDRVVVRAVLDDVYVDGSAKKLVAVLRCGDRVVGRRTAYPGRKRAVFFDPVDWPDDAPLSMAIEGGTAASTQLDWRMVRQ